MPQSIKKVLILTLCCWMAAVAVNYLTRKLYPVPIQEEIRFVPQSEVVEILSMDHEGLAADLIFIQVVLNTGSLMWKPLRISFDSQWNYRMMDLVTRLDPKFYAAYLFSAMGLIHNFSDVKLARPILERGMRVFPQNWELPFWIGYGHHVYLEDYKTASEFFWRAAHLPGAPKSFLSLLLSSIKKGGSYEQGIWVLETLIKNTADENKKRIYKKRIVRLNNLIFLQKAVKQYVNIKGRLPDNLDQLLTHKIIPDLPEDPMGKQYVWNAEKKRVEMASERRGHTQ